MPVGGMTLMPRGGLSWSSAKADTFDDVGEPWVGGTGRVTMGWPRASRQDDPTLIPVDFS